MKILNWIKELLSNDNNIRDYGIIGKSHIGFTKVIAKISLVESVPRLILIGKSSFSSYKYVLDINNKTLDKFKTIHKDMEAIIVKVTRIADENGILDNGSIPLKCANCSEKFESNQRTCSQCGKSLENEKTYYENGDILGYLELFRECHS